MQNQTPAWYCARTKPKHEHIAAANVSKHLGLEVFHPRLQVERATIRGVRRIVESLFPGYLFIRCVLADSANAIQYTDGINGLVHFGDQIPTVADSVIEELQECFVTEAPLPVEANLAPGEQVLVAEGSFAGMSAIVLRTMPARQRVQVMLEILGGNTLVEVNRSSLIGERNSVADWAPILAAPSLCKAGY
jgi:transcriptional antiterminator RfaH